jgi:hypothetical protein
MTRSLSLNHWDPAWGPEPGSGNARPKEPTMLQFLRDLTLIPRIWRHLVRSERSRMEAKRLAPMWAERQRAIARLEREANAARAGRKVEAAG